MAGDVQTHTDTPFPNDILSSTFDISRVLNSLGLHAHALVREQHRGRTFSTWRRSRKWPPLPSPLFIFFYFSPVPRLLDISNELLLSYSTVTAFFLANGFLHASSPPPPLAFSPYLPSLLLFFFPLILFFSFLFSRKISQSATGHKTRSTFRAKSIMQARFRMCFVEEGREKKKKEKRKLDTKLDHEWEKVFVDGRNNRRYSFRDIVDVVWPIGRMY